MRLILALILLASPAAAFDHYILSLSWSPTWCAQGNDGAQCHRQEGFVLHGLWPQDGGDWPEWCDGGRDPTRAESRAMEDIMPPGLPWYQWKKHGRCSGLSGRDYYALTREAYGRIELPEVFTRLRDDIRLPASVVEDAFVEANPDLSAEDIAVTCDDGMIDEVRICLNRDLTPRPCEGGMRECRMRNAEMPAP